MNKTVPATNNRPGQLDDQTLDKIAQLARLRIAPEQRLRLRAELDEILNMVSKLQQLDTQGVAAMTSAQADSSALRLDQAKSINIHSELMQHAPEQQHGYYLVPKVIE